MTTQDLLREFVQLEKDRRVAEETLKGIKERLSFMQEPLQEYFLSQGIQNQNVDGLCVYMEVRKKARKKVSTEEVVAALHEIGHDEIVQINYHWKTLQSLVNDYLDAGEDIPKALEEAVELTDEVSIRTRRS